MKTSFTEEYYRTGNYVDYLTRQDRYDRMAREITGLLGSLSLITPNSKILDFGCATGMFLLGLDKCGFAHSFGYDISEWATARALEAGCQLVDSPTGGYDVVFCMDVLEHMTLAEVHKFLDGIRTRAFIVRVPVCDLSGEYVSEVHRRDPTHLLKYTHKQWERHFKRSWFSTILSLSLDTMFTSENTFCALCL